MDAPSGPTHPPPSIRIDTASAQREAKAGSGGDPEPPSPLPPSTSDSASTGGGAGGGGMTHSLSANVAHSTPAAASAPPPSMLDASRSLSPTLAITPRGSNGAIDRAGTPLPGHSSERRNASSPPLCNFVDSMLTESAGLLMSYAHWRGGHADDAAVFDLFFRTPPFHGEFALFAGLEEVLRFLHAWQVTPDDVAMLRRKFPQFDPAFFQWLLRADLSGVRVYAVKEGSVVFPRLPLLRVEGPLAICQLLESPLLSLVNYASLVATNAARHRLAVGPNATLLEFGLRRAQGPDGAMSASRYAYLGGFDGTSNVKAAAVFGMAMRGTHAHSFVVSFYALSDVKERRLKHKQTGEMRDFVTAVLAYRAQLKRHNTHEGELAAFIAYAIAFPNGFLALLDTFDTLESGLWNFLCVALALHEFGYRPLGIRLDSGDLAYLSREVRKGFVSVGAQFGVEYFPTLTIVASNDLNEKVIYALKEQGHEIDTFGVGTNLVVCQSHPSLGCVYKLVEVRGEARMKVSADKEKVTLPGQKEAYRLYNSANEPVLDLLVQVGTVVPQPQRRILCRHPFHANQRVYVTPHAVVPLHHLVWDGSKHSAAGEGVNVLEGYPSLDAVRAFAAAELKTFREDHLRRLNPTPYKLSVSSDLFAAVQDLWLSETPISEIV